MGIDEINSKPAKVTSLQVYFIAIGCTHRRHKTVDDVGFAEVELFFDPSQNEVESK